MIKYLLLAVLFVVFVFFSLNYWEKIKGTKKKNLKSVFLTIFIVVICLIAFLLYD